MPLNNIPHIQLFDCQYNNCYIGLMCVNLFVDPKLGTHFYFFFNEKLIEMIFSQSVVVWVMGNGRKTRWRKKRKWNDTNNQKTKQIHTHTIPYVKTRNNISLCLSIRCDECEANIQIAGYMYYILLYTVRYDNGTILYNVEIMDKETNAK